MKIRAPEAKEGAALWNLVRDAGTLELNSPYTYLLMANHFAETCLLAEDDGEPLGAVVAYRPPSRPEAIFVWQVGVAPAARGRGLGRRLLTELVHRASAAGARYLEATVTPGNAASRALFRSVARELGADCRVEPYLTEEMFPEPHEAEELFRIGPLRAEPPRRRA